MLFQKDKDDQEEDDEGKLDDKKENNDVKANIFALIFFNWQPL